MRRLFADFVSGRGSIGLLIVRLISGLGLMFHGFGKIQKPFSWMGPDSPVPAIIQSLAAISEFGGGLALILGLLTPIAAFGIFCTMMYAILSVHLKNGDPFVNRQGGRSYEVAALYLASALLILITGPGTLSLDARLFGRKRR